MHHVRESFILTLGGRCGHYPQWWDSEAKLMGLDPGSARDPEQVTQPLYSGFLSVRWG